jgi:hypothetical protein
MGNTNYGVGIFCSSVSSDFAIKIISAASFTTSSMSTMKCPYFRNVLKTGKRVRFPALPDYLRSSGSGTGSTQPCEYNWGATWKKSSGSCLENREYSCRNPSRWTRDTLYPQKLAIALPTSGGRSVGRVRSRTQTMEFSLVKGLLLVYTTRVHISA